MYDQIITLGEIFSPISWIMDVL